MKTTIPTTASKTILRRPHLALLLAALAAFFTPQWTSAAGDLPFKGSGEGAVVGLTPGPEGVLLTVAAKGRATHLGQFSREEMVLLNPATGAITGVVVFTAAN